MRSNIPPPLNKKSVSGERYESLDGLRAYAAIGIVMMHTLANISVKPSENYVTLTLIPWFTDFTLMFMVISGFSLCCGYYEGIKTGSISLNEFYKKRYMRILPFFMCLCFLDLFLSPSLEQVYMLFANATLCFNLIPNVNITMIGVGWFLGIVFVFYLLFPFFVFMLDNKHRGLLSLGISLTLVWMTTVYSFNAGITEPHIGRQNIIYCMPLFMAGGMAYLYRDRLAAFRKRWMRAGCLMACAVVTVAFFVVRQSITLSNFGHLLSELVLFTMWLIYAMVSNDVVLNNSLVKFVSGISMEVYLCHMVIFRIVEKLHLEKFIGNADLTYMVTCVAVIGGAICFSWIMKRYVLAYAMGCIKMKKL